MTRKQLAKLIKQGKYKVIISKNNESHTSKFMGYISRVDPPEPHKYKGKFGEGYVLKNPNYGSTRFSYVTYIIKVK